MSTAAKVRSYGTAMLLSLSLNGQLLAQADTIPKGRLFGWRDLAILEGFAILAVASAPLDRRYARRLRDSTLQENMWLQKTARFVRTVADPGSYLIGATMYAVGRATKNEKAADLGLHGTEALALGHGLGLLLKGIVGLARRMYNNRHWASDVITGAAIGTMAGVMVVRWHHMNPGNTIDRFFLGASIRSTSSGRVVSLHAFPMF